MTKHAHALAWTGLTGTALLALAAGCASAIDAHAIQSPNVPMTSYKTFAFETTDRAPGAYAVSPQSSQVQSYIEEKATALLERRGYVPAKGSAPDFVVRIESGRRRMEGPLAPTDPGQTEMQYGGALDDEERDRVEGSFIVDAFDARTHALAWHGAARSIVDPTHVDHERLDRAIEKVLASFPAHGAI